jgi:sulfite exporter TauE/SafE
VSDALGAAVGWLSSAGPALFVPVLGASLLGSVHCVGMCGPFVAFYAGADETRDRRRWLAHAAYHGGRLVTYTALGAAAGFVGAAIDLAGAAAGTARLAAVAAGAVMILWGLVLLLGAYGVRLPARAAPGWLERHVVARLRALRTRPPVVRAGLLGLASTLLPCGWLYAFAVTAAGTGRAASGALVMLAFWLGSVPLLLGTGVGLHALLGRFRERLPVVTALVLVGLGAHAVFSRVNLPSFAARALRFQVPGQTAAAPAASEHPCCH